ncbi:MAG: M4 family metallopeptidase, partial [Myxococcales bacterium]|nr:M4 family metallopeptidase [Myxococcales bacterium]
MRKVYRSLAWISVLVTLGAGATVACSQDDAPDARAALAADTGAEWIFEGEGATPEFMMPRSPTRPIATGDRAQGVIDFVAKHQALFGLADAKRALAPREDGEFRVVVEQRHGGVPVLGGGLAVQLDDQGRARYVESSVVSDSALAGVSTAAKLDSAAATAAAGRAFPGAKVTATAPPALVVYAVDRRDRPVLAWEMPVAIERGRSVRELVVDVDAATGALVATEELAHAASAAEGSGVGVRGARRTFAVSKDEAGTYTMREPATDGSRTVITASSVDPEVAQWLSSYRGTTLTSRDPASWDPAATGIGAGVAVDAYYHTRKVDEFFRTLSWAEASGGRERPWGGLDGRGTAFSIFVHSNKIVLGHDAEGRIVEEDARGWGAFYHGNRLFFPDGLPGYFDSYAGSLSVVAHEFMHGVSDNSARWRGAEGGTLNEAVSDVLAYHTMHWAEPGSEVFTIGHETGIGGRIIRRADHPGQTQCYQSYDQRTGRAIDNPPALPCPDHYEKFIYWAANDAGQRVEPHTNVGIVANAWYLMTKGGQNDTKRDRRVDDPIGWDASKKLWFATVTKHMRGRGQGAMFRNVARAMVAAADEQGVSRRPVVCAWYAVGVLGPQSIQSFLGSQDA